jgi:hypothetical protein
MARKTVHDLIIKLGGDAKEFEHLIRSSKQKTKGFKDQFMDLKKAIAGAFAVREMLQFTAASLKAAADQQSVEAKLLHSLGEKENAQKRLIAQAKELQETTTFSDNEIIAQQAFLASLGMTEAQIKKIIPAAADLSTALGQTLETGVRNLAKTYSGLTGELGELVPELKNFTAEQLKAGAAVEYTTRQFNGQAEAMGDTMAGRYAQFTYAMSELKETIGAYLGPFLSEVSKKLTEAANNKWFNQDLWNKANDKVMQHAELIKKLNPDTKEQDKAWEELYGKQETYIQDLYDDIVHFQGLQESGTRKERKDAEEKLEFLDGELTLQKKVLELMADEISARKEILALGKQMTAEEKEYWDKYAARSEAAMKELDGSLKVGRNWVKDAAEELFPDEDVWGTRKIFDNSRAFKNQGWDMTDELFPDDENFYEALNEKYQALKDFSNDINSLIGGSLADSFQSIGDLIEDAFSGDTQAMDNFLASMLGKMGDFSTKMGALMVAYGIAQMEFFTSWKEGPAGAAKLIAAGAALIAIGGAIKGVAKSQTNSLHQIGQPSFSQAGSNSTSSTLGTYRGAVLRGDTIAMATLRSNSGIRGGGLRYG